MILLTWQKIPQAWKWISTSWSGLSIHFAHGCKILHAKGWSQKSTTLKAEPLTMSSLYFFLSPWWRSLSWLAISLYWSLSCWQVSSSLDRMRRASFLLSNFRLHTKNLSKQCTSHGAMRYITVDWIGSHVYFRDHSWTCNICIKLVLGFIMYLYVYLILWWERLH